MAIYDSKDKVQKWRYEVKNLYIIINGKNVNIPAERVTGITITYDYLQNLYPMFKLDLVISSDTYYLIQQNKNSLQLYLRIDKFFYYEDKKLKADGSKESTYKPWINDTFEIIMDNNSEDLGSSLRRDEALNDYTIVKNDNSDKLDKIDNGISIYLYKSYNALKTNVNKILKNVNVTDAIVWLLTQGKVKNVIMQQPENTKINDVIVIPPMSISKALYHIDTYYGLYKLGTIFFSDFDYFYIIPFDSSNRKAFIQRDIKVTNLIVPKSGSKDHSNEVGSLKKANQTNENFIIVNTNDLSITNASISNDLINGSDANTIDSYSGDSIISQSNAVTKGKSTTKVEINPTENDFYTSMKTAISKSLSTEIKVTSNSFDIDAIKPNKIFTFLFEDSTYTKKYQGQYMIDGAVYSFSKEGEALELSGTMIFRKMK